MPVFKTGADAVTVSADFIENYAPEANGAYVKVYLYVLLIAARREAAELSDIAQRLSLLESDVKNAIDYWKNNGQISGDDAELIVGAAPSSASGRMSAAQISRLAGENAELAELCAVSESILGKSLSPREIETLYWIYDELGFGADAIAALIEYCVSRGKRSVRYAEKVAVTWRERGIVTLDAIDAYIRSENERANYFYSLRKLFGIADRPLSKKEEEYLKKWNTEFRMDEDMVALAYEYCIIRTGKISFPYMDTILANWNARDIRTVADAEREHAMFRAPHAEKSFDVYRGDMDHSELERLTREGKSG